MTETDTVTPTQFPNRNVMEAAYHISSILEFSPKRFNGSSLFC